MRQACEGLWPWVLRFWEVSLGGRAGGREGQPATGLHPPTPPPRKNSSQAHRQGGLPWEAKPSVQSWVPPPLSGPPEPPGAALVHMWGPILAGSHSPHWLPAEGTRPTSQTRPGSWSSGHHFPKGPGGKQLKSAPPGNTIREREEASENPDAGWRPGAPGATRQLRQSLPRPEAAPAGLQGPVAVPASRSRRAPEAQSRVLQLQRCFNINMAALRAEPGQPREPARKAHRWPCKGSPPATLDSHSHRSRRRGRRAEDGAWAPAPRGPPAAAAAPDGLDWATWSKESSQAPCSPHRPPTLGQPHPSSFPQRPWCLLPSEEDPSRNPPVPATCAQCLSLLVCTRRLMPGCELAGVLGSPRSPGLQGQGKARGS